MKSYISAVAVLCVMITSCARSINSSYQSVNVGPKSTVLEHEYSFKPGDIVYNVKTNVTYRIDSVQTRKTGLTGGRFYYATDLTTGKHVMNLLQKVLTIQTDNSRYAGTLLP